MNLLEKLVERTEKRLKRIDENPDPTKLSSNRLGYEIDLDHYKEVLAAWQQGKPLLPYFPSTNLAKAMGALTFHYESFADQFPEEAPRYSQAARSMGLPEYLCDTLVLAVAGAMLGELPPPAMGVVCPPIPCRIWTYHMKIIAEHFDVPKFEIDAPQEYSEESVKYLANQFAEFIKFAESKVPGLKYDEDRHLELMKTGGAWGVYGQKDWEMRKHVPLPWDSRETFRQPVRRAPGIIEDTAKVFEYWRQRTGELEQQIARGVDRKERLRLLWIWGRPVYLDPVAILESRGVSVPAVVLPNIGRFGGRTPLPPDEKVFGRKLSPLELEAKNWLGGDIMQLPQSGGRNWGEDIIWACKELSCDAVVFYQCVGCLHMGSPARLIVDMVEKELGVPALIIAGREMEPTFLPPAEFEARLIEFIDMVLDQKERKQ